MIITLNSSARLETSSSQPLHSERLQPSLPTSAFITTMRLTIPAIISALSFSSLTTAIVCTPGSLHPVFTLDPVNLSSYYAYTSPSTSGPHIGNFSFTLTSDQTDYATECIGISNNPLGQFYGAQTFACNTPSVEGPKSKTSFSYDTASQVVGLNTSWTYGG
jgi:hypothetical protein